jgi:hypothetical protein
MMLRPIDMKNNKLKIEKAIKFLDRLTDFFKVKK